MNLVLEVAYSNNRTGGCPSPFAAYCVARRST
jgi:hypothetical protein